MKFGTCDGAAIYNLRTESMVEITKPIMQKSANRNYFTRWSHQGYVLDGYRSGDVARGKHILPMQERHRPVVVGIQGADCLIMVLLGIKIEIQYKRVTTCVMKPTCTAQARGVACFGRFG